MAELRMRMADKDQRRAKMKAAKCQKTLSSSNSLHIKENEDHCNNDSQETTFQCHYNNNDDNITLHDVHSINTWNKSISRSKFSSQCVDKDGQNPLTPQVCFDSDIVRDTNSSCNLNCTHAMDFIDHTKVGSQSILGNNDEYSSPNNCPEIIEEKNATASNGFQDSHNIESRHSHNYPSETHQSPICGYSCESPLSSPCTSLESVPKTAPCYLTLSTNEWNPCGESQLLTVDNELDVMVNNTAGLQSNINRERFLRRRIRRRRSTSALPVLCYRNRHRKCQQHHNFHGFRRCLTPQNTVSLPCKLIRPHSPEVPPNERVVSRSWVDSLYGTHPQLFPHTTRASSSCVSSLTSSRAQTRSNSKPSFEDEQFGSITEGCLMSLTLPCQNSKACYTTSEDSNEKRYAFHSKVSCSPSQPQNLPAESLIKEISKERQVEAAGNTTVTPVELESQRQQTFSQYHTGGNSTYIGKDVSQDTHDMEQIPSLCGQLANMGNFNEHPNASIGYVHSLSRNQEGSHAYMIQQRRLPTPPPPSAPQTKTTSHKGGKLRNGSSTFRNIRQPVQLPPIHTSQCIKDKRYNSQESRSNEKLGSNCGCGTARHTRTPFQSGTSDQVRTPAYLYNQLETDQNSTKTKISHQYRRWQCVPQLPPINYGDTHHAHHNHQSTLELQTPKARITSPNRRHAPSLHSNVIPHPPRQLHNTKTQNRSGGSGSKRKTVTQRCEWCRTKLKFSYKCRCDGNFCAKCRYSDRHSCSFDYQKRGKHLPCLKLNCLLVIVFNPVIFVTILL